MCGIAGFLGLSQTAPLDADLFKRVHSSLHHRGPDSKGIFIDERHNYAALFARLAIIDLSDNANQPMVDQDDDLVIVFNGEIYNYQIIRKELEALGATFLTNSDTEAILWAFKKWGVDCLKRLEGMFAFALFSQKTGDMWLVRDRFGIKPLYFTFKNGILAFASEIKTLLELPWVDKKISPWAAYHYFTYMVAPAPATIFEGIYKLPNSMYMHVRPNKTIEYVRWYTPFKELSESEKKEINNEQYCIEKIRFLLENSVKKHMVSDVPVGAFLSGGIDSSLIVALMARHNSKLKTFTVAFSDGPEFNELIPARAVAQRFGTEHHEILISENDAASFYPSMVKELDEPLADCVCVPFNYVAEAARKSGLKVVQVGEGADELFFGYPLYLDYLATHRYFKKGFLATVPRSLKRLAYNAVATFLPRKFSYQELFYGWAQNRSLFWSGAIAFPECSKEELLMAFVHPATNRYDDPVIEAMMPGLTTSYDSYSLVDYHLKNLASQLPSADFGQQMLYLEYAQRLPELLLMRADKMSMANSLEGRVPFLDHELFEFMAAVPTHLKVKNGVTKYLLKEASRGIIPDEIIYRKKVGFAAPTSRWFSHDGYFKSRAEKLPREIRERGSAVQKWTYLQYEEFLYQHFREVKQ